MKMTMMTLSLSLLLALPALAVETTQPLTHAASLMGKADLAKLRLDVMADRLARPAAYDLAKLAVGCRPEGWMQARSPEPSCAREMRALGANGLLPMLSALTLEWRPAGFSTDSKQLQKEQRALTVAMVDAVGLLRDLRARPVLLALWKEAATEAEMHVEMGRQMTIARAVAEALGRMGGAVELQALQTRLAVQSRLAVQDKLRLAAIAGLGACKRQEAAQSLVMVLGTARGPASSATDASALTEQAWIVQAMGAVASSWAWEALGPTRAQDGLAVRTRVTEALLPLLVKNVGPARERVVQSLQLADLPTLPAKLAALRLNADPTLQHDIDDLLGRVARAHASL